MRELDVVAFHADSLSVNPTFSFDDWNPFCLAKTGSKTLTFSIMAAASRMLLGAFAAFMPASSGMRAFSQTSDLFTVPPTRDLVEPSHRQPRHRQLMLFCLLATKRRRVSFLKRAKSFAGFTSSWAVGSALRPWRGEHLDRFEHNLWSIAGDVM
jgi:hypothetical protein